MLSLTQSEMDIMNSGVVYVYAYYKPDNIVPFYIGKGTKFRCLSHIKRAIGGFIDKHNSIKSGILSQIISTGKLPVIRILVVGIADYCNMIEKKLIAFYGRKCNTTGCLSNITEGGEGGENGGIAKANTVLEAKYGPNYRNIIIAKGREVLRQKYGPNFYSFITKMGATAQKILYGSEYNNEMQRRSAIGNSDVSISKKRDTYIKKHGSLSAAYAHSQVSRIETMNKIGWSVKCYDIISEEIKVVKKDEFDSSSNLVGMRSKLVPLSIRQVTNK